MSHELPTIETPTGKVVRLGNQLRYCETEAQTKDAAFEMALGAFIDSNFKTFNATDQVEIRGILFEQRHDLHRRCNLLNGGNAVSVTAPPAPTLPVPEAAP